VPGDQPIERLAQALSPIVATPEDEVLAGLRSSPSWAAERIEESRSAAEGTGVLVFVDQLEEIWTLSTAQRRAAFLDALAALARVGSGVRLVATLRADFLAQLDDLGALRPVLLRAPVMVGALSSQGLRRAIVEPARRRGVEIEPALADRLLERAGGAPSMLPLLEYALARAWDRRPDGATMLTSADLDTLGGLEGALSTHADAVLERMASSVREEARRILLALVTVEGTRARRNAKEVVGTSEHARAALDALVHARLVIATAGEDSSACEIAHEILVSGWPTLRQWLADEAAVRMVQERLRRATAEWERLARAPGVLWGARALREVETVGALVDAGDTERAFVAASRAALRRAQWRRRSLVVGVPLLLSVAGASVWVLSSLTHRASVARAIAGILAEARARNDKAEGTARKALAARSDAFARFDKDDLGPAEEIWKQALALEATAEQERRAVSEALDRALALDPRNASAHGLYADVTLQRLLAAERLHQGTREGELRAELEIHDDGSRVATLHAPGHVTVQTEPAGAALRLARYGEDGAGRLVENDAAPLAAGESRELQPGSYLVVAHMPGRYPTRYPFVLRPGEESSLRIVLPRAEDVAEGMIYVPAGRTLYGVGDDEETRGFLTHQPMHDIEVPAFLIARTEVTNAEYIAFLNAQPNDEARKAHLPIGLVLMSDGQFGWRFLKRALAPGQPYCNGVDPCVDWSLLPVGGTQKEDGQALAEWLARSRALPGARLCTDREWERAARGADDRRFPAGNRAPPASDACSLETYRDSTLAAPCAVGTHPASRSPFGVDDLEGNMCEWASNSPDIATPGISILRSGSFFWPQFIDALPNRGICPSTRGPDYGIRLCADVK
jgi:formylglycine-generating enzyme required for sulfatase activity